MKAVLIVLAGAVFTLVTSAQTANVSGTWELEMVWPAATSTGSCSFKQEADKLTGTCGGAKDRFPVTGRVDGNRLSWRVNVTQDGSTARMEFSGELDATGTRIRGTCSIIDADSGTFTMKRTG